MGFGEAIATCLRKYVRTRGRATRSEFWYFTLFALLVNIGADVVDAVIDARASGYGIVGLAAGLGLFLPGVAVTVRRLHDTDHAGWWYFLPATIIGIVPFLIFMCARGTPGANRYGLAGGADIARVFGGDAQVAPR